MLDPTHTVKMDRHQNHYYTRGLRDGLRDGFGMGMICILVAEFVVAVMILGILKAIGYF